MRTVHIYYGFMAYTFTCITALLKGVSLALHRNYCDSVYMYYSFSIGRARGDYATSRVVSKHCRAKAVGTDLGYGPYILYSAAAEVYKHTAAGTSTESGGLNPEFGMSVCFKTDEAFILQL